MNPQRLLTIFAILVVLLVLFLYMTSSDEAFLEPDNTGPPEVTETQPGTGRTQALQA